MEMSIVEWDLRPKLFTIYKDWNISLQFNVYFVTLSLITMQRVDWSPVSLYAEVSWNTVQSSQPSSQQRDSPFLLEPNH